MQTKTPLECVALRLKEIWAIRIRLRAERARELALFNLSRPVGSAPTVEGRAVRLLLGQLKVESTVRYLGIEVDDALEMAEQTEV